MVRPSERGSSRSSRSWWSLQPRCYLGSGFNYARFDRLFVTTKLGYNLYTYYHPRMTADQRMRSADIPLPDLTGAVRAGAGGAPVERGAGVLWPTIRRGRHGSWWQRPGCCSSSRQATRFNRRYALASLLSYGVLVPFMVIGAILSLRHWPLTWPLLLWAVMGSASGILVFAGIRLRMRIEPILLLFAAVGIVELVPWLLRSRRGAGREVDQPERVGG